VFYLFNCAVYVCTCALPYVCMHSTHVYDCVYASNCVFKLHARLHFEQRIGFEISGERWLKRIFWRLFDAEKRGGEDDAMS